MGQVLIVSGTEKSQQLLAGLFLPDGGQPVTMAASGTAARRLLAETEYELVLVNAPLKDEFGHELAQLAAGAGMGAILLVKEELEAQTAAQVEGYGVFVLPRPLNRSAFYQALKLVRAARARIERLMQENRRLQEKLEELRIVDRAKYLLMERLGFTEGQAHRYIEKQAMDRRVTRRSVAQGVLNTYEM